MEFQLAETRSSFTGDFAELQNVINNMDSPMQCALILQAQSDIDRNVYSQ